MYIDDVRFPNSKGLSLAGRLYVPSARNPPVAILAHCFKGDKSCIPLYPYCAGVLQKKGYAVFLYDSAGFGESGGRSEESTPASQISDLESAIGFVRDCKDPVLDSNRIGLIGHSLGATAVLGNAYQQGVNALILLAASFNGPFLSNRYKDLITAAKNNGKSYIESPYARTGRVYKIGLDLLDRLKDFDYTSILSALEIPVCVISAGNDSIVNQSGVQEHFALIPHADKELVVIDKANHDFDGEEIADEVAEKIQSWFGRLLFPGVS